MKPMGDSTRSTFKKEKNYSGVRMQQGRVQLDADWNEQVDISSHRIETETHDVIGRCGAPKDNAGFGIIVDINKLSNEEKKRLEELKLLPMQAGDFLIIGGHYYVNGVLCENKDIVSFTKQPDLPYTVPINKSGFYLAYLDVWQRHITAIEDPDIREVALGGPDTATRSKTVWQVKLLPMKNEAINCFSDFQDWKNLIARSSGKLSAFTKQEVPSTDPCKVSPRGGYQRLENQLYRVEIHDRGELYSWPRPHEILKTNATVVAGTKDRLTVEDWTIGGIPFETGQSVEIFSENTDAERKAGKLAQIIDINETTKTLFLSPDISDMVYHKNFRVRRVATFKWSRDNGSVIFTIEEFVADKKIKVGNLGRDNTLGLQAGDWVEVLDDAHELSGMPGTMAEIIDPPDATERILTLSKSISGYDTAGHSKVRRWDRKSDAIPITSDPIELEDGVFVQFSGNNFKTGDYWLIPARTENGDVEWPRDSEKKSILQSPHGIKHHYCRLALLYFDNNKWELLNDCRRLFPPVTDLRFFYIRGDGQEAMPEKELPGALKVGVANGQWPVKGALVKFEVEEGDGTLNSANPINTDPLIVETGSDGVAQCDWTLGSFDPTKPDDPPSLQQVKATLVDANWNDEFNLPIFFNANLSVAGQVAYFPQDCISMSTTTTVQDAIDMLCRMCQEKEPAIHITNVYLLDEKSTPLQNDTQVAVEALAKGIHVDYDVENLNENLIIDKINPATCFITLDIPFLYCNPSDLMDKKKRTKIKEKDKAKVVVGYQPLIGYQLLILEANLIVKEEFIEWKLDDNMQYCLLQQFNRQNTNWSDALRNWPDSTNTQKGILAHLTLKGNFTWADTINTIRNSKSGRDFEMWFWLVEVVEETSQPNLEEIQPTETSVPISDKWWEKMKNEAEARNPIL